MDGAPFYSAPGDGQWARQANDTWFSIWDLAKPVIAQIHGYAIAGAHRAGLGVRPGLRRRPTRAISYPVVRVMSPPDWQYHTVLLGMRRAMELMLTGDPISGVEAAADRLRQPGVPRPTSSKSRCCGSPSRVAGVPSDLTQINKRSIHRAFDVWGARAAIRAGTELQALAGHTATAARFRDNLLETIKASAAEGR